MPVQERENAILIQGTNLADKGHRQLSGCLCATRWKQQRRSSIAVAAGLPIGGPLLPHSTVANSIDGCWVPCRDRDSGEK